MKLLSLRLTEVADALAPSQHKCLFGYSGSYILPEEEVNCRYAGLFIEN